MGFPTKMICLPGTYWPPNAFPFMQAIGLFVGFGIVQERTSTFGEIGGNPNITHNVNVALNSHRVTHEAKSLLSLNLDRLLGLLGAWLTSFHDREGRFKYYKVGAILYGAAWFMAFVGNLGHHATQATQAATSAISSGMSSLGNVLGVPSARNETIKAYITLKEDQKTIYMPSVQSFTPRVSNTIQYDTVLGDARKYYYYKEVPGGVFSFNVMEASCFRVPVGRKILFSSPYHPTSAVNVQKLVTYARKRTPWDIPETLHLLSRDHWLADYYNEETSLSYAHDHWGEIRKHQKVVTFEAQAMTLLQLQQLNADTRGALICF